METRSKNKTNIQLTPSKLLQPTKRKPRKQSHQYDKLEQKDSVNIDNKERKRSRSFSSDSSTKLPVFRIPNIPNNPSSIEHMSVLSSLKLLCLCRKDNSIELWKIDTWIQLLKIPGISNLELRRVFLFKKKDKPELKKKQDNILDKIRLFSIGLNGYLIEWNLNTLLPKFSYRNSGGSIWDMEFKDKLCLIASNDGIPRCIQIKKRINPFLFKQFSLTNARNLCVTWEKKSKSNKTRIFYSGYSNGTIIKWNFETGQILLNLKCPVMSSSNNKKLITTAEDNNNNTNSNYNNNVPLIWSLCSINAQFLLAGDSFGRLFVFDINFGVLVKEFKEHSADILSIVSTNEIESTSNSNNNNNNNKIVSAYYSGVDSLVVNLQLNQNKNEWVLSSSFRGQSHDINSLTLVNEECLLSGGITTDICIYKLNKGNFFQKYEKKATTSIKRHISSFEHRNQYYMSQILQRNNFFILHKKSSHCDLYELNMKENTSNYIAKIEKSRKDDYNILSAYLSRNGKYILMSYNDCTIVFNFEFTSNYNIKKQGKIPIQANFIFINNDYTKIILVSQEKGKIFIVDINNLKVLNKIDYLSNNNKELDDNYDEDDNNSMSNILSCEYNNKNGDIYISTFSKKLILIHTESVTNNKEKEKGILSYLPHPMTYITKIKVDEYNKQIITVDENNVLYMIDINTNSLTEWTKKRIEMKDYPQNYLRWYNKIYGIVPIKKDIILLYTDYNFIKINLKMEIPKESIIEKNKMEKYINSDCDKIIKEFHSKIFDEEYKMISSYKKIKETLFNNEKDKLNITNENGFKNDNFKIVSKFNSIMFMDLNEQNTLVVVENNWSKIIKTFPGGVIKNKYGH